MDRLANWWVKRSGGYGGDFAGVLASRRRANEADVVYSAVDTVGLPLILLKRRGLIRPPLVYVAIGLPERLVKLGGPKTRRIYADALRRPHTIVVYSEFEAEALREWVGPAGPPVVFVPFGVDTDYFRPRSEPGPEIAVVAIGADPNRDFELLVDVATRHPGSSFRIVANEPHTRALRSIPSNVMLETDIPFADMRDRLAAAQVVALPVKENSYSGATTVLLQALAMGKPVVVSRTQAIVRGYGLADGENCRLVPPGDTEAFETALVDLLGDEAARTAMGARARVTAESLSWDRYADEIYRILAATASA